VGVGPAKILAQPKIMALSGQNAVFQVGGEIPIRIVTSFTAAKATGAAKPRAKPATTAAGAPKKVAAKRPAARKAPGNTTARKATAKAAPRSPTARKK